MPKKIPVKDRTAFTHYFLMLMLEFVPILEQEDCKHKLFSKERMFTKENYKYAKLWCSNAFSAASEHRKAKIDIKEFAMESATADILQFVLQLIDNYPDTAEEVEVARGGRFRNKCRKYFNQWR